MAADEIDHTTSAREKDMELQNVLPDDIEAPVYPPMKKRVVIIIGLLFGIFLIALEIAIISTAVPRITSEFKSLEDVHWYGSAFFLTLAATQAAWGKTYKYFSMRASFMSAVFIFAIGSIICAVAKNSKTLIVGRAIQGIGGSGTTLGCYAIPTFIAPPQQVAIIIGSMGGVFSLGSVLGPLLGGVFTESVTWRWCFWINLPFCGITIAIMALWFRTPENAKPQKASWQEIFLSYDPLGLLLLTTSLVCYLLATQWGGVTKDWSSSTMIGLLVGWLLITGALFVNEWYQGDNAIAVLRLFKSREFLCISMYGLFMFGAYFSIIYNVPIYFQAIHGLSPKDSGIRLIPMILSTSLASLTCSITISKLHLFQPHLIIGSSLMAIGAGLIYTFDLNTSLGKQIGYQLIFGIGTGVVQIPAMLGGILMPDQDKAVALATVCALEYFSASYVIPASDSIMNNLVVQKVPEYVAGLDPHEVIAVGAGSLQDVFDGEVLRGVRLAFLDGLQGAWALGLALLCISLLAALIVKMPGRLPHMAAAPKEVSPVESPGEPSRAHSPVAQVNGEAA